MAKACGRALGLHAAQDRVAGLHVVDVDLLKARRLQPFQHVEERRLRRRVVRKVPPVFDRTRPPLEISGCY